MQSSGNTRPRWWFDPIPPSGKSALGNSGAKNFRFDISALVREATQNSNDARIEEGRRPARIEFTLELLDASTAEQFISASGLDYLMSCASNVVDRWGMQLPELRTGLSRLREHKSLPLLIIKDTGTTGLRGADADTSGSFHAFTLGEQLSAEKSESSGGSHGLGKTTFWDHSALGTILLSTIGRRRAESSPWDERLRAYGRSNLGGSHSEGDRLYDKEAWFGTSVTRNGGETAESFEPDPELARMLRVDRPLNATGLTIVVPGLRIGGDTERIAEADLYGGVGNRRTQEAVRELGSIILQSAVDAVWPAITWGRIEVAVRFKCGPVTGSYDVTKSNIDQIPEFQHYAELGVQMSRQAGMGNMTLDSGPVWTHVRHTVPKTARGVPAGRHDKFGAEAALLVTRGDPGQKTEVFAVRGNGLTISREPMGAASGRGVRAVLLVGLAPAASGYRDEDPSDALVEAFFRTCESPAHDHWTHELKKVGETYERGTYSALRDLRDDCRRQIEELLLGGEEEPDDEASWTRGLVMLPGSDAGSQSSRVEFTGERSHPNSLTVDCGLRLIFAKEALDVRQPYIMRIAAAFEGGQGISREGRLRMSVVSDVDGALIEPSVDGSLRVTPTSREGSVVVRITDLPVPADRIVLQEPTLAPIRIAGGDD